MGGRKGKGKGREREKADTGVGKRKKRSEWGGGREKWEVERGRLDNRHVQGERK